MQSTFTRGSHAKQTFSKFKKEPSIYCSKAAVALSYSLTNLGQKRNKRAEKKRTVPVFLSENLTTQGWFALLINGFQYVKILS